MLGLNSLFKLFRKTFAPKFEGRGILPRRYYLFRALEALDEDDIDEAVRMITLAGLDKKKSARWRMVCQQIIFRTTAPAGVRPVVGEERATVDSGRAVYRHRSIWPPADRRTMS